jgi:hypothetical protein
MAAVTNNASTMARTSKSPGERTEVIAEMITLLINVFR